MDGRVEGEEVKAAVTLRDLHLFEVGREGNFLGRVICYLVL